MANKRVTRYVVMGIYSMGRYGLPLAVFQSKKEAEKYVEHEKCQHFHDLHIHAIRHRTPEAK